MKTKKKFLEELAQFEPIIKAESFKYKIPGLEPEDIQQEIRLKLWLNYSTFQNKSSFKTWANKVMRNCIYNLIRKSKTKKARYLNDAISLDDIEQ